ncbi:MAG: DUF951 domain-containing protein [Clostridiales bacterium]|nr:DUF951 domain-containing protein [Clostridiales bacterium]MBQ2816927.1 DUF951 domain-containing protein [Clostridia bacterium]MBQ4637347.1 DUF951 domain-containing protein [Clostridia bacterium]
MVVIALGDIIQTKKKHPCGSDKWEVTRIGADVKLKCLTCQRVIMLERGEFEKRYKKTVSHGDTADSES